MIELDQFEAFYAHDMDETEPKAMCRKTWIRQQCVINDLQKKVNFQSKGIENLKLQLENKQIDCDRSDRKIDEVIKICDSIRSEVIRDYRSQYDKGWKDCAISIYHKLKKD